MTPDQAERLIILLKEQNELQRHRNTILSKIYDTLDDIYGGMM